MKIYGPYTRSDGRKHIILIDNGKRKTISYPKYLLEQNIGRTLEDYETVDHINGDYTDDRIDNLQILSRAENASKKYLDNPELKSQYISLICSYCKNSFARTQREYKRLLTKNKNKNYFFCSRSCQGKIFH